MSATVGRIQLVDDLSAIQDYYYDQGMTDGLPIIPPSPERVEAMMRFTDRDPSCVVGVIPPANAEATVEALAVNAVMAGCQPEFFPVVLTAIEAMLEPRFNLYGVQATTHVVAPLVVVNGPIALELCINSGSGCFGPGWRANATIGRAIRMILLNLGGAYPGLTDKSTFGGPAKYSYVIAENEAESPWAPWHVDNGFSADTSTVTVIGCEAPHNINDHAAVDAVELMTTICGTVAISGMNDIHLQGNPLVVLGPEHAATIAREGKDKNWFRQYIHDHALVPIDKFNQSNLDRFDVIRPSVFKNPKPGDLVSVNDDPSSWIIMVAGGQGKHSNFIPTFGETKYVIRAIQTRDGRPVSSVTELAAGK